MAPAPTIIEPPAGMPRVDSEVLVVTGAVPVPIAGDVEEPDVSDELEAPDEHEPGDDEDVVAALDDDNDVSPRDCSALCTAAESWELTRVKAVSLAMLDRPFDRLLSAEVITLMSESCAEVA